MCTSAHRRRLARVKWISGNLVIIWSPQQCWRFSNVREDKAWWNYQKVKAEGDKDAQLDHSKPPKSSGHNRGTSDKDEEIESDLGHHSRSASPLIYYRCDHTFSEACETQSCIPWATASTARKETDTISATEKHDQPPSSGSLSPTPEKISQPKPAMIESTTSNQKADVHRQETVRSCTELLKKFTWKAICVYWTRSWFGWSK